MVLNSSALELKFYRRYLRPQTEKEEEVQAIREQNYSSKSSLDYVNIGFLC